MNLNLFDDDPAAPPGPGHAARGETPVPPPGAGGAGALPAGWARVAPRASHRAAEVLAALPGELLPPRARTFRAFELCPPERARVLILGQDPYHTPGVADGLAFSCADGRAAPSLRNILRELADDLGDPALARGKTTLDGWARQGVLLLNTALSVLPGQPMVHARPWAPVIETLLDEWLSQAAPPPVAIAWGTPARRMLERHGLPIVASAHPSPLSASRGFFGSRPFSRTNALLAERGQAPIDWAARD